MKKEDFEPAITIGGNLYNSGNIEVTKDIHFTEEELQIIKAELQRLKKPICQTNKTSTA